MPKWSTERTRRFCYRGVPAIATLAFAVLLVSHVLAAHVRTAAVREPVRGLAEGTIAPVGPPADRTTRTSLLATVLSLLPPRPASAPAEDEQREVPHGSPSPVRVESAATGRFAVVPGRGAAVGRGGLRRYLIEVELGMDESAEDFAEVVENTLADGRSWGGGGRLSFQRVDSGPVDFRVTLASPATTDRLCAPLKTASTYSCFMRGRAVINQLRWRAGATAYAGNLADYRQYVINHEVGHALGHGHEGCPGSGRLAPVMKQQTKGIGACRPNPWPFPL